MSDWPHIFGQRKKFILTGERSLKVVDMDL